MGPRTTGDQKSNVATPQTATPASSIDHSEGFNANNLPSLTTYATAGEKGCSAQITRRVNFADRLV
jgi:hypothetical protein